MSIPTLLNVLDSARSLLGDDQTSGGEVFTNTVLQPYFAIAYREMFRAMDAIQSPRIRRTVYYTLPAYTTVLVPSTANIADIAAPEQLDERGGLTSYTISNATINASVPSVTWTVASTSGLAAGDFVTISGSMGITGSDGFWGIANVTGTTFDTLGMVAGGSFSGSGTAVLSSERWAEVIQIPEIDQGWVDTAGRSNLGVYVWQEDRFHFPPCSAIRQLRITYDSDGTAPSSTSTSIGVEDSLNFLAARTAGLAASSRGNPTKAQELNTLALGPDQNTSNWDGFLADMLRPAIRAYQQLPPQFRRKPPFRNPKSTTPSAW